MRRSRPTAARSRMRRIAPATSTSGFRRSTAVSRGNSPTRRHPTRSPHGRLTATHIVFRSERDQGGLFRVSSEGGPETQLTTFGVHPVWSADGTEVLFRTNSQSGVQSALHAVSPDGGEQPREVAQPFARSGNWTWLAPHPDGRVSAIGVHLKSGPGLLHLVARRHQGFCLEAGEGWPVDPTRPDDAAVPVERRRHGALRRGGAQRSPERLARSCGPANAREWVAAERMTAGAGQDVAAALAPVGGRMAFSVQQQSTRLWVFPLDASTGRITGQGTPFTPEDGRAQTASLSPDGKLAAFVLVLAGRSRAELMVTDLDTNKTEVFASSAFGTTWSPDSRTLAYLLTRPDRRIPKSLRWRCGKWAVRNGSSAAGPRTRFWCRRAGRRMANSSSARICLRPLPGGRSSCSGR